MKPLAKIFGWVFTIAGAISYFILWLAAFKFIDQQIGWFWTVVLLVLTNFIGPLLFIVWFWIKVVFPTTYFLIWIATIIVYWTGNIMRAFSSSNPYE